MNQSFLEAVEHRRSVYGLGRDDNASLSAVQEIVERLLRAMPSAFNSQSGRVVILWGEKSDRLWEITADTLRPKMPADRFPATQEKLSGFAAGLGTILFFEDTGIVENLQKQFAAYSDNFPIWSLQSSGMLQFAVWTALEDAGYGASLQHYNPLIDDAVKAEWALPANWKLLSQMPFGIPTAAPREKSIAPVEMRLKVFS